MRATLRTMRLTLLRKARELSTSPIFESNSVNQRVDSVSVCSLLDRVFGEEMESSRCFAKNAGQSGSNSQVSAVTDQWDDGVGWRVRAFWEVG